ncbi:MAG: DUF21 domain-containing protein, partial [Bacteroidales bacterium]|nr:DUF21 domain-containing protein [Bacteroidales bacterium]
MNSLAVILVSLVFSAFFSGMEIAFISANKLRIELDKKQGIFGSRIISLFASKPGEYIATMLVGNNISLVIYGMVMAMILEQKIRLYTNSDSIILIIQTLISTLIILFAAEFLPKTIFRISPNIALKIFSVPIAVFYVLLYPVTWLIITVSRFILKNIMGVPREKNSYPNVFGKVDLDNLVSEISPENNEIHEADHEIKFFQNAL